MAEEQSCTTTYRGRKEFALLNFDSRSHKTIKANQIAIFYFKKSILIFRFNMQKLLILYATKVGGENVIGPDIELEASFDWAWDMTNVGCPRKLTDFGKI